MSDFIKIFSEKNKPQFKKYKKYIEDNDWTLQKKEEKGQSKEDEFFLQNDLILNIVERLKYFVKKAHGDRHSYPFKSFTKFCLSIIDIHRVRVDLYVNSVDISEIESVNMRSSQVKFLKECFAKVTKINEDVDALNIQEDNISGDIVSFRDEEKAPLAMHKILVKDYPEIQMKLDSMGVDFDSTPKNEMMFMMENTPKWNIEKHYWEQDKETLQFYVDEFKKIEKGVVIDGVPISGWMYYQLNVFNANYPSPKINTITNQEEVEDVIGIPPLRDNEWFVIEDNYQKAKQEGTMVFIAATRRAAKTTMLASRLDYAITLGKKQILCVAGSTKDLNQMKGKLKISLENKNPAFRVPVQVDDWEKDVLYGLKRKNGKNVVSSSIAVINLEKGGALSSEKLAGYTPDEVVIDEIMKQSFKAQLEALKPALDSPYGKRCVVLLSGTAGNEELAKDAFSVLSDPTTNDILNMPWEILENRIPIEHITWQKRSFGTFIPAQMSAKKGLKKIDSNLAEYLKLSNCPNLEKIKIQVTDWGRANEIIRADREAKKKDSVVLTKEILYYPIDPEEMLLSTKVNPFAREEAVRRKHYLIESGEWDRRREIYVEQETGKLRARISTIPLAPFPHRGGTVEAPLLIFEDIPDVKPVDNLYVASFDDVKQDNSDTDSLISFCIWKMKTFGDKWGGKLVLSWTCRPQDRKAMYKKWLLLQQAYNAKAFPENEDMGYKSFLETQHLEDIWLIPSVDFTSNLNIPNNEKRKYGWMPKRDKKILFGDFVDKMNDLVVIGEDEFGNDIEVLGVQQVDDIGLLDEIIDYKEGMNVDRISGCLGAIGWMKYLERNYILPKKQTVKKENEKPRHFQKQILGSSKGKRLLG